MADAVRKYRRLFAGSATLVVLLSVLLVGLVLTDRPEPATLGVGKAGIMDTLSSSESPGSTALPSDGSNEEVRDELPEGDASYYGTELAGRPTASGESFDPERLTAAHRTLPFGTRLRVTNVGSGASVIVTVNDRGPYSGDRVLDLSYSAARQIGILNQGEARVRMEVLK